MADRFLEDTKKFKEILSFCRGQLSAVFAAPCYPEDITILKGNKPLFLWEHANQKIIVYASNEKYIKQAICNEKGWKKVPVPAMTMLTIHCDTMVVEKEKFKFKKHIRRLQCKYLFTAR